MSCFWIKEKVREDDGDSDDDVNVGFIELEKSTQPFETGFLFVEFDAN